MAVAEFRIIVWVCLESPRQFTGHFVSVVFLCIESNPGRMCRAERRGGKGARFADWHIAILIRVPIIRDRCVRRAFWDGNDKTSDFRCAASFENEQPPR